MSEQLARLIRDEGLDDLEGLLTPREWDEVPLVSRLERIRFLSGLSRLEQSRTLVVCAIRYLDTVLEYVARTNRDDVLVMVSVADWEDLDAVDGGPVIPNFWICSDPERDLGAFRLREGVSNEARLVATWLDSGGLLSSHAVFDPVEPPSDADLRRVYVARRGGPHEPYVDER